VGNEFKNNEKEVIGTSQSIYDSFNSFIFSEDTRVLSKLVARTLLLEKTKNVPGDIVECGVFKGSGVLSWLKLKKIICPRAFKKVVGFDMFDDEELVKSLNGLDKEVMETLFASRDFKHDEKALKKLISQIEQAGFAESDYELIKGDVSNTSYDYISKRPGARISLLYIDIDLEIPTYNILSAFWDKIPAGGIVVFDEYANHQWSESNGVDKFIKEKKIKVKTLDYFAPTAYIEKEY